MATKNVNGTIVEMTADEVFDLSKAFTGEALAAEARATRNSLLTASDWTQVADAPVDQAAWATYRQELRDITSQAGFPETVDWPVAPN